jgi:hypothetical protein
MSDSRPIHLSTKCRYHERGTIHIGLWVSLDEVFELPEEGLDNVAADQQRQPAYAKSTLNVKNVIFWQSPEG